MVKNGILCLFFTKNVLPLSSLKDMPFQPVPWMSGLVSGLQNRVRRFESARYLKGVPSGTPCLFPEFYLEPVHIVGENVGEAESVAVCNRFHQCQP